MLSPMTMSWNTAVVDETIRTMPLTMPIDWDHPFWVILMGIEHERIHCGRTIRPRSTARCWHICD
jgi:hypothetical protein